MERSQVSQQCTICDRDFTNIEVVVEGYLGETAVAICSVCYGSLKTLIEEVEDNQPENLFDHIRGFQNIVINSCHGGFGLSHQAKLRYLNKTGIPYKLEHQPDRDKQNRLGSRIMVNGYEFSGRSIPRDDPALVSVVNEMGKTANNEFSALKVVKIPAGVEWMIEEYDGLEWVAEKHRTWD